MRINLGCNDFKLDGFINIDSDPGVNPDFVADALNLPYEDNSIDELYAGHLLEHFTLQEDPLKEWFRVLKPGGRITVTVPDTGSSLKLYSEGKLSLEWVNAVVFGAQDRKEQNHHQVFTTDILKMQFSGYFKEVEILEDSPYLLARVPWQTIITGIK
jgi:predicted SAM-dependent methyltransferase